MRNIQNGVTPTTTNSGWIFVGSYKFSGANAWSKAVDDEHGKKTIHSAGNLADIFSARIYGKITQSGGQGGDIPDWSLEGKAKGDYEVLPDELFLCINNTDKMETKEGTALVASTWLLKPLYGSSGANWTVDTPKDTVRIGPEGDFVSTTLGPGHFIVEAKKADNASQTDSALLDIVEAKIFFNDKDITNTNDSEIIIGHKCALDTKILPSDYASKASEYQWEFDYSYPKYAVKDYVKSTDSGPNVKGKVTKIEEADLKNKSVTFYWIKGSEKGEQRPLKLTVKFPNLECKSEAELKVKLPPYVPKVVQGEATGPIRVDAFEAGTAGRIILQHQIHFGEGETLKNVRYFNYDGQGIPTDRDSGITFYPKKPIGGLEYVQLIQNTYKIQYQNANGKIIKEFKAPANASTWGLDSEFPYGLGSDSPGVPLNPIDNFTNIKKVSSSEPFVTYLMYKGAGEDGIYVPIKYFEWNWTASLDCVWKEYYLGGAYGRVWLVDRASSTFNATSSPAFGKSVKAKDIGQNDDLPEWDWNVRSTVPLQ